MTRGFLILVARLTVRKHNRIFSLCHYFAIMKPVQRNESRHLGQNEMAGLKGKSGPPGNMNAFKHGLAAIQKRREESIPTEHEENVRQQILDGLIADKGGDEQISTATRIMVEVIVSDAASTMVFNAINYGIYKRIFYNFQRASIWSSPALLPFSERTWIDAKTLCKGLLRDPECPATRPQFVRKRYRNREWVIAEKLENSR